MAQQLINIGVEGNDGTGDSIREAFRKTNENFSALYAAFNVGGFIRFIDLDDTPSGYAAAAGDANKVLAVSSTGDRIEFKQLVSTNNSITINHTSSGTIDLSSSGGSISADPTPALAFHLEARNQMIANLLDPDDPTFTTELGRLNDAWPGLNMTPDRVAIPLGYADRHYTHIDGDTMTGKLTLHDHPGDLAGRTSTDPDAKQAATKYYVDNSSYVSQINLYVSTSGDDEQTNTPPGKDGRAWSFAYRTVGKACAKAEELLQEAFLEPGPYRQRIAYGDGANISQVSQVSGYDPIAGTVTVYFGNNGGAPVDQGRFGNIDITPGKIILGLTSRAQGIVTEYVSDGSPFDYVKLNNVIGTFETGEELEFAAPVKNLNISIFIESGVYEEHFPIKLPRNTAVLGDEFRRTIIRPAPGPSRSRWVDTWFFRDHTFDSMVGEEDNPAIGLSWNGTDTYGTKGYYGYHYLKDPTNRNFVYIAEGEEVPQGVNVPKDNKDIDVFLCNDSTIIRQIAFQGHGGFIMVLDPTGQILTKSPYGQNNSSFSGSLNKQRFAGGQYVDAFAGNLPAIVESIDTQNNTMIVTGMLREPQTPTSFFIDGKRYEINTYQPVGDGYTNSATLLTVNKEFIKAEAIAWITETYPTLKYKKDTCRRDVGYIVDALVFDLIYGGNIKSVDAGRKYFSGAIERLPLEQRAPTILMLNYLSTNVLVKVVQRQAVTNKQSGIPQVYTLNGSQLPVGEEASYSGNDPKIQTLIAGIVATIEEGLTSAPAVLYPRFELVVDVDTPAPATVPNNKITLLTAGNCSMLSNDFTQLNDLAYGLVANNNGLVETVSVFTYYCHAAMYANNGGQIRSLNGSNAHGNWGIVAEGADPLEVPDVVRLERDQIQVARVYRPGAPNPYNDEGKADMFSFIISDWQAGYFPYDQCYVEINHGKPGGNPIGIKQYAVSNVSRITEDPAILRVQLTVSDIAGITNGLAADLVDKQTVTFRVGSQQQFYNVAITKPAKPSTALTFTEDPGGNDPQPTYRVINYISQTPLGDDIQKTVEIQNITKTTPPSIVTASSHGLTTGDRVRFANVGGTGFTELNGNDYYVIVDTTTTFRIYTAKSGVGPVQGSTWTGTYTSNPNNPAIFTRFGDTVILEVDQPIDYIELGVDLTRTSLPDPDRPGFTLGSITGDTKIAIERVSSSVTRNRLNTGEMIFAWSGKMHRITNYADEDLSGIPIGERPSEPRYGIITISSTYPASRGGGAMQNANQFTGTSGQGIYAPVDANNPALISSVAPALYVGLMKDEPATITVRISTCRCTGHDFLDIGTGSYNQSNFPNRIYGVPSVPVDATKQVSERGKGRVYYISTDQDGFFRVGRFFTVNQGTGEVGINAGRLVLEGVSGLKFKSGVRVTSFSPDDSMEAGDFAVPISTAVLRYVDRRLGINKDGEVQVGSRRIGPGFLDRAGILGATANINLDTHRLINVGDPVSLQDAATKNFVDTRQLGDNFVDTTTVLPAATNHMLVFNGTKWVNAESSTEGDIAVTLGSDKKVSLNIKSGKIVNTDVNGAAAIDQSKLNMTAASTRANATGITQADRGLASFNSAEFTATGGWIELKTSDSVTTGVTLSKLRQIPEDRYFGRRAGSAGDNSSPTLVSSGNIVLDGDGVKHADILTTVATGAVIRTGTKTYDVVGITSDGGAISLVKTDANGAIDVKAVKVDGAAIIDTSATDTALINFFSPGGHAFMSAKGTDATTAVTFNSIVNVNQLLVDSKKILDVNGTTLEIYGPAATEVKIIDVTGTGAKVTGAFETAGKYTPYSTTDSASYSSAAIEVRELNSSGAQTGTWAQAPRLAFHWSGRVASQIGLGTDDVLTFLNDDCSAYSNVRANFYYGTAQYSQYADLAENYRADAAYEPGTVVVFGGSQEVTVTNVFNDRRVAGVVSTNPAHLMNSELKADHVVAVALQGRVPCKVIGRVQKGDLLVAAAKFGYAVVNNDPKVGTVIGKALEDKTDGGEGIIEVVVGRV